MDKLIEALEFYADKNNHRLQYVMDKVTGEFYLASFTPVEADKGQLAREALKSLKPNPVGRMGHSGNIRVLPIPEE